MNINFAHLKFKRLVQQRSLLGYLILILLFSNVLLSLGVLIKNDRIVLLPPELKQGVWVEKDQVSTSYLEEMGFYFAHLMLDQTPSTAAYQRDILLRYASPKEYGALNSKLIEDEKRLKKDNLSTQFLPQTITTVPGEMTLHIHGDLLGFVGDRQVFQNNKTYELKVNLVRGRLMIESFQSIGGKNEE